MKRICNICFVEKPMVMFEFTGKQQYRRKTCKKCRAKRPKDKEKIRSYKEKAKYGITREKIGPNVCMICGSTEKICIDHCHYTGEVRGLLCRSCNLGLGMLGDNLYGLQLAINYLDAFLFRQARSRPTSRPKV